MTRFLEIQSDVGQAARERQEEATVHPEGVFHLGPDVSVVALEGDTAHVQRRRFADTQSI